MDVIAVFKALGDSSRLSLMRALLEKSHCTEELCEIVRLAPSTVSHHMTQLHKAGLIESRKEEQTMWYEACEETLDGRLREFILDKGESRIQDKRKEAWRNKVLRTFIQFGRLTAIPVQRRKRRVILEQILTSFEAGREYPERQVNKILTGWHEDFCFLRREMIMEGLMVREKGIYRLAPEPAESF